MKELKELLKNFLFVFQSFIYDDDDVLLAFRNVYVIEINFRCYIRGNFVHLYFFYEMNKYITVYKHYYIRIYPIRYTVLYYCFS